MKKRGIGIAAGLYPIGLSYGGDYSQSIVKVKADGSVDLFLGCVDFGQGSKTVLAQIAAEELGVQFEDITVFNHDTSICPACIGSFASRITFFDGNAVLQAAREAKGILLEVAAGILETNTEKLAASQGKIFEKEHPENSLPICEVAFMAVAKKGKIIVGRGHYQREPVKYDPEKSSIDPFATLAWGASLAEVEVDSDTGEVMVLRLINAYDVGKAINPLLIEGQIEGGAVMGVGAALMENLHPRYPLLEWQPETFGDYVIPTIQDIPEMGVSILECPSSKGPFGAKGFGEMTPNPPPPAIVNAIFNAIGVWIHELPVTPEKILRALDEKETKGNR